MTSTKPMTVTIPGWRQRLPRGALLLLGIASLVTGIWGGLLRVPVVLPLPVNHANWISFHGPLMVCGFLGTVISLERAVGLRSLWTYVVPVLTGLGAAAILSGVLGPWPRWALTLGSALYLAVQGRILFIQSNLSNRVMGLGGVSWFIGNLLWTLGRQIPEVTLWWMGFLLLTILGERIELARFQKPSRWSTPGLLVLLGILGAGLAATHLQPRCGGVLVGVALLGLAGWLARFDLAWRTLRHPGLPRFMAVCLLSGYGWLATAAVLVGLHWPQSSGFAYDGALHTFFVGFVFSMIFGHAPVIFPAVLGLPVQFRWTSYIPLTVLHASLLLRLAGDLAEVATVRTWGAVGNGVAVGVFLLNTVGFIVFDTVKRGVARKRSQLTDQKSSARSPAT